MSAPFLKVEGLSKDFGTTHALADVHLEVAEKELLAVLGPTGAGKTTLLRTIAGLTPPDSGRIHIAGRDVTDLSPAERDVALVFQNFSLYPNWTVRANLEFPLKAPGRNLAKAEIAERVAWAAELLRIPHLLARDSKRLSGGEMQRVAIGRAIVRRPRLFLMDEPLTNLDAKLREELRIELADLARELGTPMVYVTHDQAEALSMADRIVVLAEGLVLQTGSPEDVYLRPATATVARQLGQPPINVLAATLGPGVWHAADGTPIAQAPHDSPGRALLGIRPEHVKLEGGTRKGKVVFAEDAGHARILVVDWAGERIHVLTDRGADLKPGDTIRPKVDAERVMIWELPAHVIPTRR